MTEKLIFASGHVGLPVLNIFELFEQNAQLSHVALADIWIHLVKHKVQQKKP